MAVHSTETAAHIFISRRSEKSVMTIIVLLPYRKKLCRQKFSSAQSFRRQIFSSSIEKFVTFCRRNVFSEGSYIYTSIPERGRLIEGAPNRGGVCSKIYRTERVVQLLFCETIDLSREIFNLIIKNSNSFFCKKYVWAENINVRKSTYFKKALRGGIQILNPFSFVPKKYAKIEGAVNR